jgi:hypothetical protein
MEDVIDNWRKLRNEELRGYYVRQMLYLGQIEEDKMGEACGMCGSKWKYIKSFGGEA